MAHVARDLGVHKKALRSWVRQAEAGDPAHRRHRTPHRSPCATEAAPSEHRSVAELLRARASDPDPETRDAVIERTGLTGSHGVRVAKCSGSQRQRLVVGTALISRPRVLILDEPSTGLDPNARRELRSAVRSHRDGGSHGRPCHTSPTACEFRTKSPCMVVQT
ncbi:ATP-binding cassette domain-containing protein [Streptomyces somaliensis]|nr:ATP-binding cassette domain-containing protein [Streptomyces somaliensis]MCP9945046.1 ATP-binding cassette domain-containing protein [Streptomyces somaliensis]MCP9961739.1 ATP-binding cassette domain-containing protein [Streptomyces somaliensis]MCP9974554.1 ATP-binding cassette domain-containing protein [Streptomyces somaliensis]